MRTRILFPSVALAALAALAACAASSDPQGSPPAQSTCAPGGTCATALDAGATISLDASSASAIDGGATSDGGAADDSGPPRVPDGGPATGIPSVGWGAYYVSTTAHNGSPTIDAFAQGAGVPPSSLKVIGDFQTGWTVDTSLSYAQGNIAGWAAGAETAPSAGRSFVVGAFPLRMTDGSMTESTIVAGTNDGFFQKIVDNWATAGYTRATGYTGTIYMRMNWEINYPSTTPGNYKSSQTTIKGWTEPGGAAYAQAMIPAWQHAVTTLRAEATAKGVPIQIVWNPTGIDSGSDSYDEPPMMYPGDDFVDVHCTDLYTNSFYPINSPDGKNYTTWPGYFTSGAAFQKGWTVGPSVPLATWLASYDNIAHFFDFADATVADSDGKTAWGWGVGKAVDYALVQGWYANATNPDGTPRKPKPLGFCESGIIDNGPGPYTSTKTDLNFLPYVKSRIVNVQQRGGNFLFFVLWNGPSGTGISSAMLATLGTTFGSGF